MKVSVTELGTYRRCRRKWKYSSKHKMNLTKIGSGASYLELGGLIHRALAAWTLNDKKDLATHFMLNTTDRIKEIRETYKKNIGCDISDEELEPIYSQVHLGHAMMINYQKRWGKPVPDNMTFASMEQEVEVPIPGTEHSCKNCYGTGLILKNIINGTRNVEKCEECNGTGRALHILTMTLDGLLQDIRDRLYVLERKTYSSSPFFKPTLEDLEMNDQFTGYAWGVSQLEIGQVRGIAYDGMQKSEKPAKGKGLETLFLQTTILKSADELAVWGEKLAETVKEMAGNPAIYPNVPWNGCSRDCSYIDLCRSEMRGEPIERLIELSYVQREIVRVQGIKEEELV